MKIEVTPQQPSLISFTDADGVEAKAEVSLTVIGGQVLPKFKLIGAETARDNLARFLASNYTDPLIEHDTTLQYPVLSKLRAYKNVNSEGRTRYTYAPVFDPAKEFTDSLKGAAARVNTPPRLNWD
jgi:hypothetical protein